MSVVRAQYTLFDDSGLPDDVYVNTFYFVTAGARIDIPEVTITALLDQFYNEVPAGSGMSKVTTFLSPQLSGARQVKLYDMADALPRLPVYVSGIEDIGGMGSGAGVGMPSEVAACLSFRAVSVSDYPLASQRGRIYLGPLDSEVNSGSSTSTSHIAVELQNSAVASAKRLGLLAIVNDFEWNIYSPTTLVTFPVETIWMDNAFDTQRRRGADATNRVTDTIH